MTPTRISKVERVGLAYVIVALGCAAPSPARDRELSIEELDALEAQAADKADTAGTSGSDSFSVDVALRQSDGVRFLEGELGVVEVRSGRAVEPSRPVLERIAKVFGIAASELRLIKSEVESEDARFTYAQLAKNGDLVDGATLCVVVVAARITAASSTIRTVTAEVQSQVAEGLSVAELSARRLVEELPEYAGMTITHLGTGFASLPERASASYVHRYSVTGKRAGLPVRDLVAVDAIAGRILSKHSLVQTELARRTHSADGAEILPGRLALGESTAPNQSPPDSGPESAVARVHEYTADVYRMYKELLGRDSLDGLGRELTSTVHYGNGFNNAFWNGDQMVYGDGDGEILGPLGVPDVVGHELTHGLVQYTAGLIYNDESGALNEGYADIAAALMDWMRAGRTVAPHVWTVGEETFTPGAPGDALRYMGDPTQDGVSRDHYASRHTTPEDNFGVHINSGIINHAFYLLSVGGQHARLMGVTVPALGIEKAGKIFFRALTHYLTPHSTFESARYATARAARDLYDASASDAVHLAWDAVGVPGSRDASPKDSLVIDADLTKSTRFSGGPGITRFALNVPHGASSFRVSIANGSGDYDLYAKYVALPTIDAFDYASHRNQGTDFVEVLDPFSGRYEFAITSRTGFQDADVTVELVQSAQPTTLTLGQERVERGILPRERRYYTIVVPEGEAGLSIDTLVPRERGDVDLYVRRGAAPTKNVYDCKSNGVTTRRECTVTRGAGIYHVLVLVTHAPQRLTINSRVAPGCEFGALQCPAGTRYWRDGSMEYCDSDYFTVPAVAALSECTAISDGVLLPWGDSSVPCPSGTSAHIIEGTLYCAITSLPVRAQVACSLQLGRYQITRECAPPPCRGKAGAVCRQAQGDCDQPEMCVLGQDECPPDGFKGAGVACRQSAGVCDLPEYCSGAAATCPDDAKFTPALSCRLGSDCDPIESCDGVNNDCPADVNAC